MASDSDNPKAVARQARQDYPQAKIVIAADSDTPEVEQAAKAFDDKAIAPPLSEEQKEQGLTNFNDLQQALGKKKPTGNSKHNWMRPSDASAFILPCLTRTERSPKATAQAGMRRKKPGSSENREAPDLFEQKTPPSAKDAHRKKEKRNERHTKARTKPLAMT